MQIKQLGNDTTSIRDSYNFQISVLKGNFKTFDNSIITWAQEKVV